MHRTTKSFITFKPKCFALAVAAVRTELRLRAILMNKVWKIYNFCTVLLILRTLAISAQNSARAESRNSHIPKVSHARV